MKNKKISDLNYEETKELIKQKRESMDVPIFSNDDLLLIYEHTEDLILGFAMQEIIRLNKEEKELWNKFTLSLYSRITEINEELIDLRVYCFLLAEEILEDNIDIKEMLELKNSN